MFRRSPRHRSTKSCNSGKGSAITRAPATCMPARAPLSSGMAAGFPDDPAALRALPGIGDYTAAAIAAIAFDRRTAAIDGNVERVVARLYAVREPLPAAKPRLRALAAALVPQQRAGDFAQALMDLGATICTPRRPRCVLCPWRACCAAAAAGLADAIPARTEKPERPLRYGVAFWLTRGDGAVLLRRRPEKGLLGGMTEIPSTPWRSEPWTLDRGDRDRPGGGGVGAACRARCATGSRIFASSSRSSRGMARRTGCGARSTASASTPCRP